MKTNNNILGSNNKNMVEFTGSLKQRRNCFPNFTEFQKCFFYILYNNKSCARRSQIGKRLIISNCPTFSRNNSFSYIRLGKLFRDLINL